MASTGSAQKETLNKFISGWKNANAEEMLAVASDDYTQQTLPFSLGHDVRPKQVAEVMLPKLYSILENYELKIHQVVHDVENQKAAVYAISKADTPFGFPWLNEFSAFITFNNAGDKVVNVQEMVDTEFFQKFFPAYQSFLSQNK
ncbi:hypothetical protein PFICI_10830 [Pestalotiopsis fici W106-1]|uniref:Monooxygenase ptaG n=1 Tax=Pestalotiopsis fici (strain W106-1 / CGMCC3.15140) TaxID=1229662 RepID=PTAG_PESFW|nr:uncharacterized protein PFICI_10830 [Pestalotiopsis fici W106-1]A0A067XNI6.1 RecName: Full=Monooxygenase ptaG; AltName: Full=Pestheic acid biosynthesis cluster protein G [Pestalotiopsis fici W106-1]AGO59045.1 PtaG [Pestalotiopsis fici]ETS76956.1 hypothetical protein PFICI_10830 [Pestalotiopsis fici W106-1]